MRRLTISFVLGALQFLLAQQPVAFVETAGQAAVLRYGGRHAISLQKDDILFPGDRVSVLGDQSPVIWFCPSKSIIRASQGSAFQIENTRIRLTAGPALSVSPAPYCNLPQGDRADWRRPRFYTVAESETKPATPDQIRSSVKPGQEPLLQELQAIESVLRRDATNAIARISKGSILQQIGLDGAAVAELKAVDSVGVKEILHRTQASLAFASRTQQAAQSSQSKGTTRALLVGISKYDRPDRELRFADRDAKVFYEFLRSPRGGEVPESQIQLLLNEQATNARIRDGIRTALLDTAKPGDTILFFFSAHGATERGQPYLIPTDGDPSNLHDTGVDMAVIRELLKTGAGKQCRVLILLDVCRAGAATGSVNGTDLGFTDASEILIIAASQANQAAIEAVQFGGGHSAFSYFVLRGLNGDADDNRNGDVDGAELSEYVRKQVPKATNRCQSPVDYPHMTDQFIIVPNLALPGIQLEGWTRPPNCGVASPGTLTATVVPLAKGFESASALEFQRLIAPGSEFSETAWFAKLEQLKTEFSQIPEKYQSYRSELRTALQDRGQQVILRYLQGEARPQLRSDFAMGENYFRAALRLDPDATALVGRWRFCLGRKLVFDKKYPEAIQELETALRFDPEGPYIFNALGIAYLELAQYGRAITAFSEAQRLAPLWLYPRHNLSLALAEDGQFEQSRAVLQAAMRQAPGVSYLPYSLGLLEARVNRLDDSEKLFRKTIALDPKRAFGYDGLAYVLAARSKLKEAEKMYRSALSVEPASASVEHNLAVLLVRMKRLDEAETLWRSALVRDPEFAPALAGLGDLLVERKDWQQALAVGAKLRQMKPDYQPGVLLKARALLGLGHVLEALREIANRADSPEGLLLHGDILAASGRSDEAARLYQQAAHGKSSVLSSVVKRELQNRVRLLRR